MPQGLNNWYIESVIASYGQGPNGQAVTFELYSQTTAGIIATEVTWTHAAQTRVKSISGGNVQITGGNIYGIKTSISNFDFAKGYSITLILRNPVSWCNILM